MLYLSIHEMDAWLGNLKLEKNKKRCTLKTGVDGKILFDWVLNMYDNVE